MSMDDDVPLASLAASAGAKLDDDAPLSSLASAAPKKEKAPPAPKKEKPVASTGPKTASPKPKVKAKAAASGKKPGADDSYSESYYSSSSSESGSGEKKPKPKKKAARPVKGGVKRKASVALKKLKSGSTAELGDAEDEEDKETKAAHKVDKRDRSVKQQVVAELLSRWWYALPDWPPPITSDYYKERFKEKKLRQVTIQEWEWVPEEENGLRKVYMLSQFTGLFRNSSGDIVDLRPQETCPCFANFMKKDLPDLYALLVKAYEEQLKGLQNSKYNEVKFEQELKSRLNAVKDKAAKAKDFKRSKTA